MKKDILIILAATIVILVIIHFITGNRSDIEREAPVQADTVQAVPIQVLLYGFPIDSFVIEKGRVKRNQNLSEILTDYDVSMQVIDRIGKQYRDIFDVRKIRAGNRYTVFCSPDTLKSLQYFVYEHTPVDYVVFDLSDSINIYKEEKEVRIKLKNVSGIIESSLWNTMIDKDYNPMLAIELSEIYAWSIDFFGLQKGDRFKVIYEELYVDNRSVGLGKVHGALFSHMDKDFWAIPFVQDSVESFYDEEGNSLRKAFLKAPLRYSRISSRFSHSRYHPILKIRRPHHGVDYAAPVGTQVLSVGDGKVVVRAYRKGGGGRYVKIKHNSVYTTTYMHLSRFGKGITVGTYVKQGDVIGYVGSSGLSTGPHLDFRFYKNGSPVDPLKVEAPPVEPVKEENREEYDKIKNKVISKLKDF